MAATYTVKQVAQILGYSTNSIYTFLKEKRIKGVRVGLGRFRIPQAELDRLLMTTKGVAPVSQTAIYQQLTASVLPPVAPTGVVEPPHDPVIAQSYITLPSNPRVEVPSLFDWFVGIGSIVLGFAMFLFSRTNEEYSIEQFRVWMPAIRTTLIAGGFGLLLTDIVGKKFSLWHRLFHIVLILSFTGYALILGHLGNLEGVVMYGSLATVLLITLFVAFGGIAGFSAYVVLILALLPGAAFLSPTNSSLINILSIIPIPPSVLVSFWLLLVLAISTLLWVGYQRDRRLFWFGMIGVSVLLVALAATYAHNLWWGRTLFCVIAAVLCLFVPLWQSLTFTHKRDRSFIFTSFGSLLVLYIIVVGALRVMQTNILDYASQELQNKVSYGKQLVESTISSASISLSSGAMNPLVLQALEKENITMLTDVSKALFEGNNTLKRVAITSANGDLLTAYPHAATQSAESSHSERDYFIQAVTNKEAVTSDQYESGVDNNLRKVVRIAVPVLNKQADVVGVIVGSIDLETLGNKLQQIVSTKTNEYFVIIDRSGKRVIHPDHSLLGTAVDAEDPLQLSLSGKAGVGEGYSSDGVRTLIAYNTIDHAMHWGIAVKAPVVDMLQATNAAGITIVFVIVLSALMVMVFLLSHKAKSIVPDIVIEQEPQSHEARVGKALQRAVRGKRKKGMDTS
jgi:excisionase family DNA binding protein